MKQNCFPDFQLSASELSAFAYIDNTFIISTKDNRLVHYSCTEAGAFRAWLEENHIRNVKETVKQEPPACGDRHSQQGAHWIMYPVSLAASFLRKLYPFGLRKEDVQGQLSH